MMKERILLSFRKHFSLVLIALLIATISFFSGIEIQQLRTVASMESVAIDNLLLLDREISNVIRTSERKFYPNTIDIVVLRNASANIRDSLTSPWLHHKTVKYPNSLLYLIYLNDNLQGTEDIAFCVQHYATWLADVPIDRDAGLYAFLAQLELHISTPEGQLVLQELQNGNGLVSIT